MKEQGTLPEMQELAKQIGEFIHYWGFKRIHGRIWTHLFLAEKPLDAADLVSQLSISKALVSISIRELIDYNVVMDVGRSTRGTTLYRTNPDILSVILSVLRQREKRMLLQVKSAHEGLSLVKTEEASRLGISQDALGQLGLLVAKANFGLESIIGLNTLDLGEWQGLLNMRSNSDMDITAQAL